MLTFRFTGADGCMTDPEILTSGMVGKQVRLEFSSDWDELQKTAVFIGGNTVRSVRNVGETVEIPHEVLKKPLTPLYVGVYGISLDGRLAIPTIRVQGPTIVAGVKPSGDEQAEPTLPVWASIEKEISLLRKQLESLNGISAGRISALDGMFRVCAYDGDADYIAAYAAFKAAFGITDSEDSGEEESHTHSYTARITTAATCTTAGVKTYTCECGESYTESIPAAGHNYVDGVCSVCGAADPDYVPDVTLSGISATYSGGDVAVGTAVADLTGIVVTAHYSDGGSKTVTDYTLSGEIAEGENTVTVTYGGMAATFTVTGVAEEETAVYQVVYALTKVTSSNGAATAVGGEPYTTTLTADDGCQITAVLVNTGPDITSLTTYIGNVFQPDVPDGCGASNQVWFTGAGATAYGSAGFVIACKTGDTLYYAGSLTTSGSYTTPRMLSALPDADSIYDTSVSIGEALTVNDDGGYTAPADGAVFFPVAFNTGAKIEAGSGLGNIHWVTNGFRITSGTVHISSVPGMFRITATATEVAE